MAGRSYLSFAMRRGAGVNVDSTDKEGLTALLWVCQHRANRKELIRVLINLNASLTLTEPKNGNAALHCAVLGRGYLSSIRALLHAGQSLPFLPRFLLIE